MMMMAVVALTMAVNVNAQFAPGTWSISPKAGLGFANISNMEDLYLATEKVDNKMTYAASTGVEMEYQAAKMLGIPVLYYISPQIWAWRKGRAKSCAKLANEFVAIFPHELPPYEAAGARISFVGNPLVDTVRAEITPKAAEREFGLQAGEIPILLLPGSRRQEIEMLLPDMLGAAKILKQKRPETRFYLPVADAGLKALIEAKIATAGLEGEITLTGTEHRYALMGMGAAAMATSGTVVMEAALMGLPCVVLYRFAWLSAMIGRLVVHVEHFSLPNILLGEGFQPELLQEQVTPENIAVHMLPLYPGEARREITCAKLKEACRKLGEPGAACRVAEKVLACARRNLR